MVDAISAPGAWSQGHPVTVTVRLRNLTSAAVQTQAWFILGPPGSSTPWTQAAYTLQPFMPTSVPANGVRTLSMPWAGSAPAGPWEVSVWVRCSNPATGTFADSDGAWLAGQVVVS
jgi:hypothetical protein